MRKYFAYDITIRQMLPNFRSGNIEFYIKVRMGTSSARPEMTPTNGGKSLFYKVRRRKIDEHQSCANLKQHPPSFTDFDTVWHFSKMLIFAIFFSQSFEAAGITGWVHIYWPSFGWETSIICKTATKHFFADKHNLQRIQILCSGNRIVNKSLWWTDFIVGIAFTQLWRT